ncbi:flagellar basal body-associated FliL family protein [Thiocystis violascens]|uniref:Flagellar protein FliL n=1 Tax=Thiocystis violascens (strain ATCC 17096 / DSM 198 / 6111) TaxID=765911 RepID=I3Y8B7_THIV6|nr:flagellar basal body-associated FliL family protein [Thiocystis violascens]AFL73235.1 flagellar basal body-associated protein [Thiocystis violascens DSM 198]
MKRIDFKTAFFLTLILCLPPTLGQASEEKAGAYPGYLAIEPSLVVNLAGERKTRYLRVEIQCYLDTAQDAERVTLHMPLIRDRLITLLGGRDADQIMSTEARDRLRAELLEKLRETLTEVAGAPTIRELYFTGFIIQ